jgi:hypothetical protein
MKTNRRSRCSPPGARERYWRIIIERRTWPSRSQVVYRHCRIFAHEDKLDPAARDTGSPEPANTAYGDATVRQVMVMTIGVQYSENYADPAGRFTLHDRGCFRLRTGRRGPADL